MFSLEDTYENLLLVGISQAQNSQADRTPSESQKLSDSMMQAGAVSLTMVFEEN